MVAVILNLINSTRNLVSLVHAHICSVMPRGVANESNLGRLGAPWHVTLVLTSWTLVASLAGRQLKIDCKAN